MTTQPRFTPGPWQWEVSSSGHVRLATPDRGRLIVMDCVRKGMHGADVRFAVMDDEQPRGRRGGILRSVSELVKNHPDGLLDHPDAHLILASPSLYAALERLLTGCESIAPVMSRSELHELRLSVIEARAALNQARGEA